MEGRNNNGQFSKGNKLATNGGRPKGSKNKKTLLAEVLANDCEPLLASFTPQVLKIVAEQALDGCRQSQKMFLDRAIPIQKAISNDERGGTFNVSINVQPFERENFIEGSFKEET